jgi:hypothetical protein
MTACWVHCRSCGQTYMTDPGDRCSLCRELGTLIDTNPPSPIRELVNRRDRTSESITPGVGLLGMLIGTFLGAVISGGLLAGPVPKPADPAGVRPAERLECGLGIAVSYLIGVLGGAGCGAAIGGIGSVVALGVVRLAMPSLWTDP